MVIMRDSGDVIMTATSVLCTDFLEILERVGEISHLPPLVVKKAARREGKTWKKSELRWGKAAKPGRCGQPAPVVLTPSSSLL